MRKKKSLYRRKRSTASKIKSVEKVEGESIETKMRRILSNQEKITDGAPEVFTERKDGVIAAYNIRTDRFEIAAEAMNYVAGSIDAKRDSKVIDINRDKKKDDGGQPDTPTNDSTTTE